MFHFHILLLVLFLGSTEASCRARQPGLDQNLTSISPIIDDPQLSTTTLPDGNHTCLIPYLYKTEFDEYASATSTMTTTLDNCRNACLDEIRCVAIEYRKDTSQCRTFTVKGRIISFDIKPCYNYYVTVYVKIIFPTSVPCTPLKLYKAWQDVNDEVRVLENGERYHLYGTGRTGRQIADADN
ncbi:unnamed protein product [Caenorhabditis nigoni]